MTAETVTLTRSEARSHVAVALDLPTLPEAETLISQVSPYVGVAKVGMELYYSVGPAAVRSMQDRNMELFVDLKLHDIPTTVNRAARAVGKLGVRYLNFHAAGGKAMLEAAVEGFLDGYSKSPFADERGAVPLAVTVLTSDNARADVLAERARIATEAGCLGVVCAVGDIPTIRSVNEDLLCVTPGIRPACAATNDQVRVATPPEAIAAGSDVMVIGRPISAALNPAESAEQIIESLL